MARLVTCLKPGVYRDALTRGKKYEVLDRRADGAVRVRGDNARTRWYSPSCFDLEGGEAPMLVRWRYEHEDFGPIPIDGWEDVEFELSDGTSRWCAFVTPNHLRKLVENPDPEAPPGTFLPKAIVARSLEREVIDAMMRHLDREGELIEASEPRESEPG